MNSSEYIKKERPFSLEVFRHTGHSRHLLIAAELPICSRNAETPKTVSRCLSLPGNKKRRIATTLLSCSEDGARERYSIICCAFSFC